MAVEKALGAVQRSSITWLVVILCMFSFTAAMKLTQMNDHAEATDAKVVTITEKLDKLTEKVNDLAIAVARQSGAEPPKK